jgi:RimJ/RimL family protein N-acetyltransferase
VKIELLPFEATDVDQLLTWITSEAELTQWSGPYFKFPLQRNDLLSHLLTAEKSPPIRKIFKAVRIDTGAVAGHIELNDLDFSNRSASLARVLVNPEFRNQGICLPMVNSALTIAFDQLNLHRISLRVYDFNHPAIHCYERAGFRREGFFRHYSKVGDQWWDSWSMAILEDEWQALHPLTTQENR